MAHFGACFCGMRFGPLKWGEYRGLRSAHNFTGPSRMYGHTFCHRSVDLAQFTRVQGQPPSTQDGTPLSRCRKPEECTSFVRPHPKLHAWVKQWSRAQAERGALAVSHNIGPPSPGAVAGVCQLCPARPGHWLVGVPSDRFSSQQRADAHPPRQPEQNAGRTVDARAQADDLLQGAATQLR